MAFVSLSKLPGWRLADPSQDLRGCPLSDGTITDLVVNTDTDEIEKVVLDNGRAFPVRLLPKAQRSPPAA
jgi:hypothetical protein